MHANFEVYGPIIVHFWGLVIHHFNPDIFINHIYIYISSQQPWENLGNFTGGFAAALACHVEASEAKLATLANVDEKNSSREKMEADMDVF